MADISKLNLTGSAVNIKDAFMRSITPSNASESNKLATMSDVGGGGATETFIFGSADIAKGNDSSGYVNNYSIIFYANQSGNRQIPIPNITSYIDKGPLTLRLYVHWSYGSNNDASEFIDFNIRNFKSYDQYYGSKMCVFRKIISYYGNNTGDQPSNLVISSLGIQIDMNERLNLYTTPPIQISTNSVSQNGYGAEMYIDAISIIK